MAKLRMAHAWCTQAAWAKKDRTMVKTMAKLRMAHASRLGQKSKRFCFAYRCFFYFLGPGLTLVPRVFSYLSVYCFSSTLIGPKNLIFGMPPYFDPTRSKKEFNTQGTRAGPGFHDRTLAVKSRKNTRKSALKNKVFEDLRLSLISGKLGQI